MADQKLSELGAAGTLTGSDLLYIVQGAASRKVPLSAIHTYVAGATGGTGAAGSTGGTGAAGATGAVGSTGAAGATGTLPVIKNSLTTAFGLLGSNGGYATATLSATGAVLGDIVAMGIDQPVVTISYRAWVSAADVVTIWAANVTPGPETLPSATYTIAVFPYASL